MYKNYSFFRNSYDIKFIASFNILVAFIFIIYCFIFTLNYEFLTVMYFFYFSVFYFFIIDYLYFKVYLPTLRDEICRIKCYSITDNCTTKERILEHINDIEDNTYRLYYSSNSNNNNNIEKINFTNHREEDFFIEVKKLVWLGVAMHPFSNIYKYLFGNFIYLFSITMIYILLALWYISVFVNQYIFTFTIIQVLLYSFIFLSTTIFAGYIRLFIIVGREFTKKERNFIRLKNSKIKLYYHNVLIKQNEINRNVGFYFKRIPPVLNSQISFLTTVFLISVLTTIFFKLPNEKHVKSTKLTVIISSKVNDE
jgi:hypothetical protein